MGDEDRTVFEPVGGPVDRSVNDSYTKPRVTPHRVPYAKNSLFTFHACTTHKDEHGATKTTRDARHSLREESSVTVVN